MQKDFADPTKVDVSEGHIFTSENIRPVVNAVKNIFIRRNTFNSVMLKEMGCQSPFLNGKEKDEADVRIINFDEILPHNLVGNAVENTAQGNTRNSDFANIEKILKSPQHGWDFNKPPMSVIELTNEKLIKKNKNFKFIFGDGRTRTHILKSLGCKNAPYVVYRLTKENDVDGLLSAESFLSSGKNAENNSDIHSKQDTNSIVDQVVSWINTGLIKLNSDESDYADHEALERRIDYTFGENIIFKIKGKATKITDVINKAFEEYKKRNNESSPGIADWDINSLCIWSGMKSPTPEEEEKQLFQFSREPFGFKPARLSEDGKELLEKGEIYRFHNCGKGPKARDAGTKNDFLSSIFKAHSNWIHQQQYAKPDPSAQEFSNSLSAQDKLYFNPKHYKLVIALYMPTMNVSDVREFGVWGLYVRQFKNFMKTQLEAQKLSILYNTPKITLKSNTLETFDGKNCFELRGIVPSCTDIQYMDRLVSYNPYAHRDFLIAETKKEEDDAIDILFEFEQSIKNKDDLSILNSVKIPEVRKITKPTIMNYFSNS